MREMKRIPCTGTGCPEATGLRALQLRLDKNNGKKGTENKNETKQILNIIYKK